MTRADALEARPVLTDGRRPLVLVADDEPDIRRLVAMLLQAQGYDVVQARDGAEALRLAVAREPDLVLLDIAMPGTDGLDVCRAIQQRGPTAPPVVFLTANGDTEARVTGLDAGAIDYIVKPFVGAELAARVRAALRAKARHDDLAAEAARDALTGLLNRGQLDARVDEAVALADRGRAAACVMIDVDGFKGINDTYGHVAGDRVLAVLAERLRSAVRASDVVGRYGGDEFLVVCEATSEGATLVAEKVWRALTYAPVVLDDGTVAARSESGDESRTIHVGVSVGAAVWAPTMEGPEAFVGAADKAMYRAKRLGGNRVSLDVAA